LQEADLLIAELDSIIDPRRSVDLMALHYVRSWWSLLHGDAALAKKEAGCMLPLYADSAANRALRARAGGSRDSQCDGGGADRGASCTG